MSLPPATLALRRLNAFVAAVAELLDAGAEYQAAIHEACEQIDIELWMSANRVATADDRLTAALAAVRGGAA